MTDLENKNIDVFQSMLLQQVEQTTILNTMLHLQVESLTAMMAPEEKARFSDGVFELKSKFRSLSTQLFIEAKGNK